MLNLPRWNGDALLIDIGCNDGYITKLMAPHVAKATGVEPCKTKREQKPENVKFYEGNISNDYLKFKQLSAMILC